MDQGRRRRGRAAVGKNETLGVYGMRVGGAKKKKKGSLRLRMAGLLLVVSMVIAGTLYFAMTNAGRGEIGRVTRIGATLSQNVMPFGDSVLFYDGTTIHCIGASGGNEWSYQIGANADYDAHDERIVAWSSNDVFILNSRGRLTYNSKMNDAVQFASVGKEYVAVYIGSQDNGVVTVIDSTGMVVDNIAVSNQTLLDIGFFYSSTSSSSKETELMWTLGLDTTGNVLSMELQTFDPGRFVTGKSSLGEHIAYKVYDTEGTLNVVDTRMISHYNYRALEQADPTLIYGYTVADVRKNGRTASVLLLPSKEQGDGRISNLRLMTGGTDRVLHLPSECIGVLLGTRDVYGISGSMVYACRLGDTRFTGYGLTMNVTAVLGMLSDNRAIVASGAEIYVIELPTP